MLYKITNKKFIIILIIGALLTVAICMLIGLNQSVWFDEAYSIMLAKRSVSDLITLTSVDVHPPLYYLILKLWAGLFGFGEISLRSLSAITAGGAVFFGGLLIKKAFNNRIALTALPFIVLAPFLLRYGFEIRMYAFASLIGILATYILVLALNATSRRNEIILYVIYVILVVVGIYSLYYMALIWISHLVWLIWLTLKNNKSMFKSGWFISFIISFAIFIPWLPIFIKQISNGALAAISQSLNLNNLTGIFSFLSVYQPSWQLSAPVSMMVLFVIFATIFFSIKAFKIVSEKQKPYLVLLVIYALVPIIILAVISLARPMYVERYLAHTIIGAYLFIGVAVAMVVYRNNSIKIWLSAGALLLIMIFGVFQLSQFGNYNFQRLQKPTIKDLAAKITICDDQNMILAAGPYEAIELSYYLPNCNINFYSNSSAFGGGYAPLSESNLRIFDIKNQLSGIQQVFYVHYGQSELEIPSSFEYRSDQSYGSMVLETFKR